MSRPLILVFGAGASYGARCWSSRLDVDPAAPPMGDALADYLIRWLDANDPANDGEGVSWRRSNPSDTDYPNGRIWRDERTAEVRKVLARVVDEPTLNFEARLANAIEQEDLGILIALNRIIAPAMLNGRACLFEARPDRFDALLTREGHRLALIVSLNYDTLTEDALERAGMPYRYPDLWQPKPTDTVEIPFVKLHGSVNFLHVSGAQAGANLEVVRKNVTPTRLLPQKPLSISMQGVGIAPARGRRNIELTVEDGRNDPVLATYARGKPTVFDLESLDLHRASAFTHVDVLRDADVHVIGLRRPADEEDDPTLSKLLHTLGTLKGERLDVNPFESERTKMAELGFAGFDGGLAEYLRR